MKVKKGDNVLVIAGKDKGVTSKVLEVSPKTSRVIVENVNMVSKHKKARNQQEKSGIVRKASPIDSSNVQVICPSCSKATRVAYSEVKGQKVRVCKKCKASLDKEFKKAVKKEVKKEEKAAKVPTTLASKAPVKTAAPKKEVKAPAKVTAPKATKVVTTKSATKTPVKGGK